MPERYTSERAQQDKREGKAASTQAGEYVREEIHHVREGKHGARSAKQVIAIGLSKARRDGVKIPARKGGPVAGGSARIGGTKQVSTRRSRAMSKKLRGEGHSAASHAALSRQARKAAKTRS